jgi:hypothetical protein
MEADPVPRGQPSDHIDVDLNLTGADAPDLEFAQSRLQDVAEPHESFGVLAILQLPEELLQRHLLDFSTYIRSCRQLRREIGTAGFPADDIKRSGGDGTVLAVGDGCG